ncbi:MAG: 54S ribosomal protein L32, mitochondrial [Icmadophila ericetorum]|nr:54S ribosomal protein L32, mitochondrial [Icmadophila ericetorum]
MPQTLRRSVLPPLLIPSIIFPSIAISIPSIISEIWESILRAVPKKRTSYSKKRSRFLAGKALKDVTNINKCSACGAVKRAHLLCPYCVQEIRDMWSGKMGQKEQTTKADSS